MTLSNLKNHVLFTEHQSVMQICQPLIDINIPGFIYMRQFDDGSFIDLATELNWGEFFLNNFLNGHYSVETVKSHMFMRKDINLWMSNPDNQIWIEGQQYFGYGNGISLCIENNDYNDIFCFYTDVNRYNINEYYIRNLERLKLFCHYFLEKADKLIKKGSTNKLYSPKLYIEQIDDNTHDDAEDKIISDALLQLSPFGALTQREIDSIKLIIKGYSAKEAADKLYLSKRTIEAHLKNAKIKLDCKNICQLSSKITKILDK